MFELDKITCEIRSDDRDRQRCW